MTDLPEDPSGMCDEEANAPKDLEVEGREIENPFKMSLSLPV